MLEPDLPGSYAVSMHWDSTDEVRENLAWLLARARDEDLGGGDVTGDLLSAELPARGDFVARQEQVLCGGAFLEAVASAYDSQIVTAVAVADGTPAEPGQAVARWSGPARSLLAAERVALNVLQRLGGIATLTRQYVRAVEGTGAAIYDTRKTAPGWRALEKYAVRTGGGHNHRQGLFDAVLVKDNHLAALAAAGEADPLGSLAGRLAEARAHLPPHGFVEVEVDTLDQLQRALSLPVDVILLDNMAPAQLCEAVAVRDAAKFRNRVALEASGGVTLETVADVARTGVDRIAVGAITHSAPAVDIGLDFQVG